MEKINITQPRLNVSLHFISLHFPELSTMDTNLSCDSIVLAASYLRVILQPIFLSVLAEQSTSYTLPLFISVFVSSLFKVKKCFDMLG